MKSPPSVATIKSADGHIYAAMTDVKEIIAQFKARLATIYGTRLKQVILYGSHARNEARPVNLEHSALLSVYPVSESDYMGLRSPLMINLRREGVRA